MSAGGEQFGAGAKRLSLKDLNVKDAPLRMHCPVEEVRTVAVNPFDKAMLKLLKAVEGADAVVAPLALGGHVDHRTAREATAAMAMGAKPWAFYEDLPDALEVRRGGDRAQRAGDRADCCRCLRAPRAIRDGDQAEAATGAVL